jgi:hypothetical protein
MIGEKEREKYPQVDKVGMRPEPAGSETDRWKGWTMTIEGSGMISERVFKNLCCKHHTFSIVKNTSLRNLSCL